MVPFAPSFAALLKQSAPKPVTPVESITQQGVGAGTGMITPERLAYSQKLAALIKARQEVNPTVSPEPWGTRG